MNDYQMSELQLHKLARADAETRAAQAEFQLEQFILEDLVRQLDPKNLIRTSMAKVRGLNNELSTAIKNREEVSAKIGEELGVDLKDCTFDDQTGAVHLFNEEPSVVPSDS